MNIPLNQTLDARAFLVFQRLYRTLQSLNVISALIAGASISGLQFPEFHPPASSAAHAAEGLLVSSATCAVISIMLATMLMFLYEGAESATARDGVLLWTPLALLDWSIVSFLLGVLIWYADKSGAVRGGLVCGIAGVLLLFSIWVSVFMYRAMRRIGGLGKEEREYREANAGAAFGFETGGEKSV